MFVLFSKLPHVGGASTVLFFPVLGVKFRASGMLGKHLPGKLDSQSDTKTSIKPDGGTRL